uniref:HERPUD family member 2 n=1 Tax=Oryzias sinensis TaxID=183150 RepID=A0A8C7XVD1_9TELE
MFPYVSEFRRFTEHGEPPGPLLLCPRGSRRVEVPPPPLCSAAGCSAGPSTRRPAPQRALSPRVHAPADAVVAADVRASLLPTVVSLTALKPLGRLVARFHFSASLVFSHAAVASAQPAAPPVPAPSPSPMAPAQPNEAVQPLGPAQNPLPEDQPANPIQMNAQGGPVLNDDELNRDWLDWLYTVSRAGVLLSIVYFYSSFSRFVMVAGAMLLVYL